MNNAQQQPERRPDEQAAQEETNRTSQLYYFPQPEPYQADFYDSDSYRTTLVHQLPQARALDSLSESQPREITFGRVLWHLTLLGLTIFTTSIIGMLLLSSFLGGLLFSFTLLMILGAHEMGHYIACRWYGVRATLPFFIPAPIGIGTFGAFIKIKSPIPTRRALFDIGIAGPLAGFVFALPAAFIGIYYALTVPHQPMTGELPILNDSLLFIIIEKMLGVPRDIEINPIWFAAWVGMLVTSLNLLPVGQLDGGHVTYALFDRRGHRRIALSVYFGVITLAAISYFGGGWMGWLVYVVILTLMLRVGHPSVMHPAEPLGFGRVLVAAIGLIVFLLCFMPFPISF